jgi:hypothetical protein
MKSLKSENKKTSGEMYPPKDEVSGITHKLQEAYLGAQKTNDRLLVYLIERALFQAEKMAAENLPPSNSRVEQPELAHFSSRGFVAW